MPITKCRHKQINICLLFCHLYHNFSNNHFLAAIPSSCPPCFLHYCPCLTLHHAAWITTDWTFSLLVLVFHSSMFFTCWNFFSLFILSLFMHAVTLFTFYRKRCRAAHFPKAFCFNLTLDPNISNNSLEAVGYYYCFKKTIYTINRG